MKKVFLKFSSVFFFYFECLAQSFPSENFYTIKSRYITHNLTSTASVAANYTVTYRAGNQVHLQPGFSATGNSVNGVSTFFHAFIHACDHAGNSFMRYQRPQRNSQFNSNTASPYISPATFSSPSNRNAVAISVYPNPSEGSFTFALSGKFSKVNSIEVTDLLGRTVFSMNFVHQTEKINLDLQNGTYLLKYFDGPDVFSQPIMINK